MKKKISLSIMLTCFLLMYLTPIIYGYSLVPNATSNLWDDPQDIKWYYHQNGSLDLNGVDQLY